MIEFFLNLYGTYNFPILGDFGKNYLIEVEGERVSIFKDNLENPTEIEKGGKKYLSVFGRELRKALESYNAWKRRETGTPAFRVKTNQQSQQVTREYLDLRRQIREKMGLSEKEYSAHLHRENEMRYVPGGLS